MVRRVITGNDEQGRSYIVSDEDVAELLLWRSVEGDALSNTPGGIPTHVLPSTAPHVEPPPGGSRAMQVGVRPWKEIEAAQGQDGAVRLDAKVFHRTTTVDHIMMITGEVALLLDTGETTLRAGDMLVQRNTNHAWQNRTDQPARFWAVMVALTPA